MEREGAQQGRLMSIETPWWRRGLDAGGRGVSEPHPETGTVWRNTRWQPRAGRGYLATREVQEAVAELERRQTARRTG